MFDKGKVPEGVVCLSSSDKVSSKRISVLCTVSLSLSLSLSRSHSLSRPLLCVPRMFLYGQQSFNLQVTMEKDQELAMMRKTKRQQKEFFKKMEEGKLDEQDEKKEPKLLVGKITKSVS